MVHCYCSPAGTPSSGELRWCRLRGWRTAPHLALPETSHDMKSGQTVRVGLHPQHLVPRKGGVLRLRVSTRTCLHQTEDASMIREQRPPAAYRGEHTFKVILPPLRQLMVALKVVGWALACLSVCFQVAIIPDGKPRRQFSGGAGTSMQPSAEHRPQPGGGHVTPSAAEATHSCGRTAVRQASAQRQPQLQRSAVSHSM